MSAAVPDKRPVSVDRLAPTEPPASEPVTSPFRFTDIASEAGIDFVHFSGMTPEKHFPSANGSGVAMFDYDGDGKLDVYFATCTLLPLGKPEKGSNRLYRNLGNGKFEERTEASGLGFRGFCHGIVVGDIDNDGDPDVFLCNYGPNVLYLNNGDGTFTDISKKAGIDTPAWSSGGAFLDYDNDGDLDLYVANYGDWHLPGDDKFCGDPERKIRRYCSPRELRTAKHFLYRNNGDLTFTEVAEQAGIARTDGHGFGVVTADLNGDGKIDIYVANDQDPNFLFLNRGDGTFDDATETSGAAFDGHGQAQSGMGVDAEDVDGDLRPELFVTNFQNEYNTLYQNLGAGAFLDATARYGLAVDSIPYVGWGCALADFDNDGWPDAFVANGHIDDNRELNGQPVPYAEPALLHQNLAGKRFRRATHGAGAYFEVPHNGHGAAFGDLDDDGDLDIVVNHKDGPPAVLRNDTSRGNAWMRLVLVGTRSNRDAVGARVEIVAAGRTLLRQRKGGVSLMSAHDPRLLVGLGAADEAEKITVRWPSGARNVLEHVPARQTVRIVEPRRGPSMRRNATRDDPCPAKQFGDARREDARHWSWRP